METSKVHTLELPLFLVMGKTNKNYYINLNGYRNWHYRLSNALKREYKDLVTPLIETLPSLQKIECTYRIYYPTKRKFDLDNIGAISAKFFQDALVEAGKIPDDNYDHIVKVSTVFGEVDNENPRVEVDIKEI